MLNDNQTKINEWQDMVYKITKTGTFSDIEIKPDFVSSPLPPARLTGDIDIYIDDIVINNSPLPRTTISMGWKPNLFDNLELNVYPTATSGKLYVSNREIKPASLEVYTTAGQMVISHALSLGDSSLNLTSWGNGVYLFKFLTSIGTKVFKIQKY
jgi:hypothetical protein